MFLDIENCRRNSQCAYICPRCNDSVYLYITPAFLKMWVTSQFLESHKKFFLLYRLQEINVYTCKHLHIYTVFNTVVLRPSRYSPNDKVIFTIDWLVTVHLLHECVTTCSVGTFQLFFVLNLFNFGQYLLFISLET